MANRRFRVREIRAQVPLCPPTPSSSTSRQKSVSYWVSGIGIISPDRLGWVSPRASPSFFGVDVEPVDVVEDAFGVIHDATHRASVWPVCGRVRRAQARRSFTIAHNVWSPNGPQVSGRRDWGNPRHAQPSAPGGVPIRRHGTGGGRRPERALGTVTAHNPRSQLSFHCALLDPRTTSTGSCQKGLVSENFTGGASRTSSP